MRGDERVENYRMEKWRKKQNYDEMERFGKPGCTKPKLVELIEEYERKRKECLNNLEK